MKNDKIIMKQILSVLLIVMLSGTAFSQGNSKYQSVVAATKMNVLYAGVDNPVDVMVAGVASDKVTITVTNGSAKVAGPYKYIIVPQKPGTLSMSINVNAGGKIIAAGQHEFRVKRVPDPMPEIAGMKGGTISKALLLAQTGVNVELENFDYDLNFQVVSYTVLVNLTGMVTSLDVCGADFNPKVMDLVDKCKPGTKIYFEDIKAKGPDGVIRQIGNLAFKLE